MVTFVSIFLWLTVGLHSVEVAVQEPVATVVIELDGIQAGVATGPEWKVDVDFGSVMKPHELLAVAFDMTGIEIGRARQVVNLPRAQAEVKLVLEGLQPGTPDRARVVVQNVLKVDPERVDVMFDSQPLLPVDGTYHLPDYDPEAAHIVSAEAFFPFSVSARDDISFGGRYGGRVASELTAVAIEVTGRRRPRVEDFDDLLVVGENPARVVAVERPGARVLVVRDHGAWKDLGAVGATMTRRWPAQRGLRLETGTDLTRDLHRYSLLVPNPVVRGDLWVFPVVGPFHLRRYNLAWLASRVVAERAGLDSQQLADAVAVAGVRAARESSPRAVVLILSDGAKDASRDRPQDIRAYLQALQVPFVVWTTGEEDQTPWGTARFINSPKSLMEASEDLMKPLLKQWIVWIEGGHLPTAVRLKESAGRFRLAGSIADGEPTVE